MFKKILKKIIKYLNLLGINPIVLFNFLRGAPSFITDYFKLRQQAQNSLFPIEFYPILDDKYKQGGTAKGHYFHQDLLVAKKIYKANPKEHIDIGSRVDGFIAHLAVFRKIVIIDIRELMSNVENIEFLHANMMEMKEDMLESCESLSCLHALEHFGLGRYGDPIDFNGHIKGFNNMHKLLKENGIFYFSVPIGKQRIEFNAHRVFSLVYLLDMFKDKFEIVDFSFVNDEGNLNQCVELTSELIRNNCNCYYGCGIFELRKKSKDD